MRLRIHRAMASCVVALLALTAVAAAQNRWQTDCHRLTLRTATELPGGVEQSFSFEGPCTLSQGTEGNLQIVAQIHLRVEAIWTPGTGQLHESVASDGEQYKGYMVMKLHCDQNPLLARADCTRLEYSNTTGWRGFDDFKYKARAVSMGRVSPDTLIARLGSTGDPGRSPPDASPGASRGTTDSAGSGSSAEAGPDSGLAEIPLAAGTLIPLEDQRLIGTVQEDSGLRWAIFGRDSVTILRRYPEGVRMLKNAGNEIFVDWGGMVLKLGKARGGRLNLPPSLRTPSSRN